MWGPGRRSGDRVVVRGSRAVLKAWMRWKSRALADIPRPLDRPFVSTRGTPVLECVAFGNGALTGWGVASHQLGLLGALARSLSRRFGRGVTVRGTIDPDFSVRSMLPIAARLPWESAQIGVLSFGPDEILDGSASGSWQRDLAALVTEVRDRMPAGSSLAVLGIPALSSLGFLTGLGGRHVARLIDRFNAQAAAVCAGRDGVQFVPLPDPLPGEPDHYRTAQQYAFWADVVVAFLGLEAPPELPPPPSAEERSRSAERLGVLDGMAPTERFDRIVRLAQSVFRTTSAAFTVLHDNWQWHPSRVGLDAERLPRDQSICDLAIAQSAPLVVGDTWADGRFDANPLVREGSGIRFYAGYPLRAPDGNFVGALCVFDPVPRDPADIDIATLRDLALMIEVELGDSSARADRS